MIYNDLQWSAMIYNDRQWGTMIYNELQWATWAASQILLMWVPGPEEPYCLLAWISHSGGKWVIIGQVIAINPSLRVKTNSVMKRRCLGLTKLLACCCILGLCPTHQSQLAGYLFGIHHITSITEHDWHGSSLWILLVCDCSHFGRFDLQLWISLAAREDESRTDVGRAETRTAVQFLSAAPVESP